MPITRTEMERRLGYHPVKDEEQRRRYEFRRAQAIEFAMDIIQTTPESREQSLALTAIQDGLMWANAADACAP